ncbi:MAG: MCP four helix bundle domain-containing protein [Candidatus Riflebacteria bacterium]|nr:MCP four helix bundle domain-containing protein [Candidatus Riflebacteria bacterium]
MTILSCRKELLWMTAGAVIALVIMFFVHHFKTEQNITDLLSFKARRADLVGRLRLNLALASEAEKSAVLAVTDKDSQTFADQARSATAEMERELKELGELLAIGGTTDEKSHLDQFTKVFTDFQHIDNELLDLAVKNSNIKAYSLAFGPAADTLKEMDSALSRLVAKNTETAEAKNVAMLAFGIQAAALRIQTLLAPHIAEESDKKMDDMEALMTREDQQVLKNLSNLAALPTLRGDPDLATATMDYTRFNEVRGRILVLSRENTNVRSLAISLGQKRKVSFLCQDILSALQQAILEEPIAGVNNVVVSNPRSLQAEFSGKGN